MSSYPQMCIVFCYVVGIINILISKHNNIMDININANNISIDDMVDDQLIKRFYIGYSKAVAIASFKQGIKCKFGLFDGSYCKKHHTYH